MLEVDLTIIHIHISFVQRFSVQSSLFVVILIFYGSESQKLFCFRNQGKEHSQLIHCMMHYGYSLLHHFQHSSLGQETLSPFLHFSYLIGIVSCSSGQHGFSVISQPFFAICHVSSTYGITSTLVWSLPTAKIHLDIFMESLANFALINARVQKKIRWACTMRLILRMP